MLFKLFLLFILVPLIELILLLILADLTSWWTTLAVVVATGLVGSYLARSQGYRTFARIRDELAAGRMPTDALVDAVMIFVAGALLLTPGMLTDLFGFSLLLPACRRFYRQWAKRYFQEHFKVRSLSGDLPQHRDGTSNVVDSYVIHSADDSPRKPQ